MTLVDSSVWIDYFNGASTPAAERLDRLLGREQIVVGDIVVTEVLQGFRSDRDFRAAQTALFSFDVVPLADVDSAVGTAQLYRALRRRGVTVRKTIDVIIASYCLRHDQALLFSDRDFEPFVTHLGLRAA